MAAISKFKSTNQHKVADLYKGINMIKYFVGFLVAERVYVSKT